MISYLIWNGSPEIFSLGSFALRWYGLLFAAGFLISQQILYYMYRKEGKPERDVDTLTIYMVVATIIGARLGHIIFYEPNMLWEHPLQVFLPFEFTPAFHFTGLQGLASHGGAFGILFALWLYANYHISFSKADVALKGGEGKEGAVQKNTKRGIFFEKRIKPGQSYLQVLDRIVILVCLTGCLIRLGNFFNSEIIGKPTNSPLGVVFVSRVTQAIKSYDNSPIDEVGVIKNTELPAGAHGRVPIYIYLFYKQGTSREIANQFTNSNIKYLLSHMPEYIDEPAQQPINYQIAEDSPGVYAVKIKTFGIARHPAQLYESVSCLLLFLILFGYWSIKKENTPTGRIFGWFLILLWCFRFAYEFLKENQESFEASLPINMGQILSIPLIFAGIFVLWYSYRSKPESKL